jgi:hypothetical protein
VWLVLPCIKVAQITQTSLTLQPHSFFAVQCVEVDKHNAKAE